MMCTEKTKIALADHRRNFSPPAVFHSAVVSLSAGIYRRATQPGLPQLNFRAVEIMMTESPIRLHPNGLAVASYRPSTIITGGSS